MSKNVIKTIGHHTFKYSPPQYTDETAPCLSETQTEIIKGVETIEYPFLGDGYYFWDYNIKRAHKWGEDHCDNSYGILKVHMTLKGDKFLDLAGSRHDLEKFAKIYSLMKKKEPGLRPGAFFKGMQMMEQEEHGSWPYTIVRALNVKKHANSVQFNHIQNSKMLLNPEIIICFYDKNDIDLQNSSVIYKKAHVKS